LGRHEMKLSSLIGSRSGALKAFRATMQREEQAWRDHRFEEIREGHLAPLISENERFDRELASVNVAVRAAKGRLEESR
jgi:hypothetical protein